MLDSTYYSFVQLGQGLLNQAATKFKFFHFKLIFSSSEVLVDDLPNAKVVYYSFTLQKIFFP